MLPNFKKKRETGMNSCTQKYLKAADLECLTPAAYWNKASIMRGTINVFAIYAFGCSADTTLHNNEFWRLEFRLGEFYKTQLFYQSVVLPVVWCESGYHGVWSAGGDKSSQKSSILCHRLCCGFSLSGLNSSLGRRKVVGEEVVFYLNIKQF